MKATKKIVAILVSLVAVLVIAISLTACGDGDTISGKFNSSNDLVISLDDVAKNIKICSFKVDGTKMEILVAYNSKGELRTAFNTCISCYDSGKGYYKVSGKTATCQNCNTKYTVDEFSTTKNGGCHPVAITASERTISDDTLTIKASALRSAKSYFTNWKK